MIRFWPSYVLRSLRRSGRRGAFAILCVGVGVAGVVALHTASLTLQSALTSNVKATNGGDISLVSEAAPLSTADLSVFRRLKQDGQISSWTAVASLHATSVGYTHGLVPFDVQVVSSPPYPLGGDPTFVSPANGHVAALLAHPGDVLVSAVLAQELGVHIGSRLLVNGLGGPGLQATVRGILSETSFRHAATMTVQRRDAAMLSNRPARYTAVYANVSGSPTPAAQTLRTTFPAATVQTVTEALQATEAQVHDFNQFMLLVGLLALLIAGIGILNAMQSMLAQRRLEIAMLKAIGFPHRTLYGLFAGEALLIGVLGGLLGTAAGAAMSKVISDALAGAMGLQVTFVIDRTTLLAGVGLGIGATLVFTVLPIVQAAGFRPLEVLREGSPPRVSSWSQTLGLLALVILLFAALAAVTLHDLALAAQFVFGACIVAAFLTGGFALVIGWLGRLGPARTAVGALVLVALIALSAVTLRAEPALGAIVVVGAALWAATVLLPRAWLLPLLIAARSLSRRRARTSVTLVAFLAGVLSMTLTLTVALSLRGQINDALAANGSSNLVAVGSPLDESRILYATRKLPGVKGSSSTMVVQTSPVAINGQRLVNVIGPSAAGPSADDDGDRVRLLSGLTGWNLARGDGPTRIVVVAGRGLRASDAGTNHVLVRSDLENYPYNLQPGASITLKEPGTGVVKSVRVVGFYRRERRVRTFGSFFTPPIYGDRSIALALGRDDAEATVSFNIDQSQLTYDAAQLQRAVPGALVVDIGDLTAAVETILNELLNVLAVITGLVLGAGVAVVANGVVLAMLERRREIALFKAVGFGGGSVLRFVLVENALIGTLAGAVSVLAAAISLRLLSHYALQQAVGFDPVLAVIVMAVAAALAVVTAYVVARKPLRVRPLEALRND